MSQAPRAFPLQWPAGWPRTPPKKRVPAPFTTTTNSTPDPASGRRKEKALTVSNALTRLQKQADLLGARYAVISSNLELRLDGMPRSGARPPDDPGVAFYFQLRGQHTVMPCDRFLRVADNIAAIAAHIDAVRRIERYGVGTIDQMFTGFQAIRGPGPKPWREVLGIKPDDPVSPDIIKARLRELAKIHHPDVGGDAAVMVEINDAFSRAVEEICRV